MSINGFISFVREQGVVGLAVGFILGGAVSKVVSSLVQDIINPILGLILGANEGLRSTYFSVGSAKIMYGAFFATAIDFIVIALVVYYGVKMIGIDRLDKKKS